MIRFVHSDVAQTGVEEASDVVALPDGDFVIVSDLSNRAARLHRGRAEELRLNGAHNDLEGVAYDPARKRLFVASESTRKIDRYGYAERHEEPQLQGSTHVDLPGPVNKGIEGMAFLPARFSPTGNDQLIVAQEDQPKRLVLVDQDGSGDPMEIAIDPALDDALGDLTGLAVDPITGHLFICSQESAAVAEVVLSGPNLHTSLVGVMRLEQDLRSPLDRVEGVAMDGRGDLYVLTENSGELHQYRRQ